jgi:hypothetical protein
MTEITKAIAQVAFQALLVIVLVMVAKSRRHRATWTLSKATRLQWLCGIYLGLLYFADWVLGVSPGIGVLGYPFAVYFLALSIYRKRDLRAGVIMGK